MHTEHWRLALKVAAPVAVTLAAWIIVFVLLLSPTEFRLFDHGNAPEDSLRWIGIAAIVTLNVVAGMIVRHLINHAEPGVRFVRFARRVLVALSVVALAAVAVAFAVLDMTFSLGESTKAVFAALALGGLALGPLFLDGAMRVRSLLGVIAIYGIFASWIVIQRNIDWNMRRHFLRAYAQIRPGMTAEQVQDVMHRHFRGKRPLLRSGRRGLLFTLDPDDGRFNSEFIVIRMVNGKVVAADYSRD
jgi:hypothetical protein